MQGRIHAIGLCSIFNIATIQLWNRTKERAQELATELDRLRDTFNNSRLQITCADTVAKAVATADVIVTATSSHTPLITRSMLKDNVHINGISLYVLCYLHQGLVQIRMSFYSGWCRRDASFRTEWGRVQGFCDENLRRQFWQRTNRAGHIGCANRCWSRRYH